MEDERLNNILTEREKALAESNSTYKTIMDNNQNLYNQQQNYTNEYENTQNDIARMNLEENQRLINQQREKAQKETDIENQKAYNAYLKANNQYGTDIENLGGLNNSGYSETYKMGTYNTYQNRVARANAALRDAFTEYDNQMYDAKKTYDVTKAQNALAKLQMQIDYLTNFNDSNNSALMNRFNSNQNVRSDYQNAYQNMLSQIQNERELEERIRQYNSDLAEKQRQYDSNMAYQRERDKIADNQWQQEYNLSRYNTYNKTSGNTSGNNNSIALTDGNNNQTTQTLSGNSNDRIVTSNVTPFLSTKKAREWFYDVEMESINNNGIAESRLESLLKEALNNKTISNDDAEKILNVFGL